jgi:hypothetical protein
LKTLATSTAERKFVTNFSSSSLLYSIVFVLTKPYIYAMIKPACVFHLIEGSGACVYMTSSKPSFSGGYSQIFKRRIVILLGELQMSISEVISTFMLLWESSQEPKASPWGGQPVICSSRSAGLVHPELPYPSEVPAFCLQSIASCNCHSVYYIHP